jgi:hypothetical protein
MADEDQQDAAAKLEPPRLFGRRRGRKASAPAPEDAAPEPTPEPGPEPTPEPEPEPADVATTQVIEADEPTEVEALEPIEPVTPVEDQPTQVIAPDPVPPAEGAPPLFADEVEEVEDEPADEPAPTPVVAAKKTKEPKAPKAPREPLPGRVAAALTGVAVGLFLVGGTYGALQGCEAVQGTATCGSAGFPLLAVIFVVAIVVGAFLLTRFAVPDATSTSFLATGMTAVVALLFLIDVIDHWSMVIVIPLVSVLTHLLSHWVTTTFIEPTQD